MRRPVTISDDGIYADRIELENVKSLFKVSDLTAQYRRFLQNGYVEVAGLLKWIKWKNTVPSSINLSGAEIGWRSILAPHTDWIVKHFSKAK